MHYGARKIHQRLEIVELEGGSWRGTAQDQDAQKYVINFSSFVEFLRKKLYGHLTPCCRAEHDEGIGVVQLVSINCD